MAKRIYLDTNHWIKLLQVKQGKEKDEQLQKIFTALQKLTESDEIIVLFSAFTLNEIWKYHKIEEQDEFIDLILEISKLWVLKPAMFFSEKEIENAVSFVLDNKYIHDINSEIIGRGIGDLFDLSFELFLEHKPEIKNFIKNNSKGLSYDYFKKDFQKMNNDLVFIKKTLKTDEVRELCRKSVEENKKHLENMEKNRFKNSEMSKDLFSRYSQARFLIDSIVPHLSKIMHSRNIKPEEILPSDNKEGMQLFIKHLNSKNVLSILVDERDFAVEKPIIENDVHDIAHLAGSIPYCDVVLCDKMFARLCKQKKLDEMYDCVILDNLKDLAQIEPIKSKILSS